MIIEKQLSELIVGHYIVDIKKQNNKLKLASPNHIKSSSVINNLKNKGVVSVLIDDEKTITTELEIKKEVVESPPSQLSSNEVTPEKLQIAKQIFNESKAIQKKVLNDAKNGSDLDLESISEVTNKSVDAIFDNPDSLACIVNIRHKDEYLLEHSISVSIYLSIFASYLNIDKATAQDMALGAFLHDAGKIMVPDKILNKPGKLTDAEFYIMKTHANHTVEILEKTKGVSRLSFEVAAYHHEKLDGTGYPFHLKANKLSKYCRMMNICDIFDALTANRCYKEGFPRFKAFSILRSLAKDNLHLDNELVENFINAIGAYPVGSLVQLSSNKIAIVERKNTVDSLRPGVRSFFNCDKNEYQKSEEIDLSVTGDFIVKGVKASDFALDMDDVIEFLIKQA
ncbi:MAG: HD-GYP domain-containing protein [Colwellia sp.]|nr:HD-GYP domain-containing protein [Colwellia sp.]